MTNNEILQANLLDILFDGRNKEYGAYAIRRGYNNRMLMALGIGLSGLFLLFFININHTSGNKDPLQKPPGIQLTAVEVAPDKTEKPPARTVPAKPAEPVKTIKNTTPVLVKDNLIEHTEVPDVETIADNISSTANNEGKPSDGTMIATSSAAGGTGTALTVVDDPPPALPSSLPEFPGGFKALQEYLSRNLATPDNLETGEKKIVRARFLVDKDGSVSSVEINVSGGSFFDREVIRVCKKMPRWKPAIQNGVAVAMSYILPVTFIGVEQ